MIDFHSHIIPNIDDGSKSVEETFAMLKEAQEAGFDSIISTSHYMENYFEADLTTRQTWINALSENLYKEKIDLKLYLGNEIYITSNIIELLKNEKASTINNTSYVLFELPMNSKPMDLNDILYNMMENKIVPVLAHPERYSFVQQDPELIYDLIQKGVLMQSNFCSILGIYGEGAESTVKKLLKHNMVHFLGSDVHRSNSIYKKIPKAIEKIEAIIGKEKLDELTNINPNLVLNNKRIDIDEPIEFKMSFKEKMLGKFK